ncbi:phosphoadenosine phosphosulfate reductase domain-containing protein [Methanocaldococcus sp.]
MYKVKWDEETNGIILSDNISDEETINISPRPVFYEELNLFGFNKYWKYPKSENPILWASGRKYYYKGELVAEIIGGNFFEEPKIEIYKKDLTLEPADIDEIIKKNSKPLFDIENEAIDFIKRTYKTKKDDVDCFTVSYSGGKDSQVVLDLVSKTLPPSEYVVIFTDTKMELPPTYEVIQKTKKLYEEKYESFQFYIVDDVDKDALSFWRYFGPPSRFLRWCSLVFKTAPFIRKIKEITKKRSPKILVFTGVRAEESVNRSKHKRISQIKYFQTNAEVINQWNTTEVFLYLFSKKLPINKLYRYGLTRVGCCICPFSSSWSEYLLRKIYPEIVDNYINVLKDHAKLLGLKGKGIIKYIKEGQWKKRAGGEGVECNGVRVDFIEKNDNLIAVMTSPRSSFLEWVKIVGNVVYKCNKNNIVGEIKVGCNSIYFVIRNNYNKNIVELKNIYGNVSIISKIKKVIYKSTYCIHCGACEVECPTGALITIPKLSINENLCNHCGNCINFIDKGCLMAKSLWIRKGENMKKLSGFGKYLTFGMREHWLKDYLNKLDDWHSNNRLGNKQVDAMIAWLRDSELIDNSKSKKATELAKKLSKIINTNEKIVWKIIWTNLFYNSSVVNWYVLNVPYGKTYSTNELKDMVVNSFNNLSERTILSGITSLVNMFENSPLGKELKIGVVEKKGNKRYVSKIGTNEIHPLVIGYILYKIGEKRNITEFTVSQLYKEDWGSPYKLFGVSKEKLESVLRYLQEKDLISVDLVAGLDNVRLKDHIKPIDIVDMIVRG